MITAMLSEDWRVTAIISLERGISTLVSYFQLRVRLNDLQNISAHKAT